VCIKGGPRIHIHLSWEREVARSHFFKKFEEASSNALRKFRAPSDFLIRRSTPRYAVAAELTQRYEIARFGMLLMALGTAFGPA
jgi:hypothetical protein